MAKQINSESQQKTTRVADLIYLIGVEFGVFSKIVCSRLAVFTFCLFLTSHIYAHEEESVSATDSSSVSNKVTQAINICPGAIAFGMLSVNYEYLFGQTHGLVTRFDYDKISESYSDDTIEANGFGFTLNYRWHWSEAMESWFLGSFLRYRFYNGSGTSDFTKFDFTMPEFTVGLNIGKRWVDQRIHYIYNQNI
jgi:hypothetical protein